MKALLTKFLFITLCAVASGSKTRMKFQSQNVEEVMDDDVEDPRLEVAMRMEELDKVHKSFSERMTDWISSVSLKQKEAEGEHFNNFAKTSSKQAKETSLTASNKSDISQNLDEKQEDDDQHSIPCSVYGDCNKGNTDGISTKSSRASFNGSAVGMEEDHSNIESNWRLGGEKEMLSQSEEEDHSNIESNWRLGGEKEML